MEEVISEEEPPGGTPLFRAKRLGKELHLDNLFIKFEGANRTGTQKDRISRLHVRNAASKGFETLSLATCGNYGASISYYAGMYGLKSVIGVPQHYANSRVQEMRSNGAEILEIPGRYEEVVDAMTDMASAEGWYDSNPGSKNSRTDIQGYEGIAFEIVDNLGHSPEFVAVPVGNGTTLSGIYSGFRKLKQKGLIASMPRMIGSSTSGGNPVVDSWVRGSRVIRDIEPNMLEETSVNEPLISYRAIDGQKALDAIYSSGGMALYVSDFDMIKYSRIAEKTEGLSVLPASASTLAAMHRVISSTSPHGEAVAVVTGRNQIWTTR